MSAIDSLIPIIKRRRRVSIPSLTQPTVLNSNLWQDDVDTGGAPDDISWTTPSGTDLLICFHCGERGTPYPAPSWNGSAMTKITEHAYNNGSVDLQTVAAYYLAAPSIGTYTLELGTFTFAAHGAVHTILVALDNASASGITTAQQNGASGTSPLSMSMTPTAATDILLHACSRNDSQAFSGSNNTLLNGTEGGLYRCKAAVASYLPTNTNARACEFSWIGSTESYAHLGLIIHGV